MKKLAISGGANNRRFAITKWVSAASFCAGLIAFGGAAFASDGPATQTVAPIKPDRVIMLDIATAGARIVAVGERGVILTSEDNAASWRAYRASTTRTLTGVAFADEKTGVAVGHGGTLLRTEDGGASWSAVALDEAGHDSLLSVSWMGGQTFATYGAFGMFFVSTDGGKTWTRKRAVSEDFDRHIYKVVPVGKIWFLAGESGTISRTRDGGDSWEALTSPYVGSFFGAVAARDGAILAYGMRGNVWRSDDEGSTWTQIGTGSTIGINGAGLLGDGTLVFVGNTGFVGVSRDNGKSVKTHISPRGAGYASVIEDAKGKLVTAGEAGVGILDKALWSE